MERMIDYKLSETQNQDFAEHIKDKIPDQKGYLISTTDDMRAQDACVVNLIDFGFVSMCVFHMNHNTLPEYIQYFKDINKHAICVTEIPLIRSKGINGGYEATLNFIFN